MKGMHKKRIKRMMKSNPQYYKHPDSYWRLPNGEAIDPNGNKVFRAKMSDIRDGKAGTVIYDTKSSIGQDVIQVIAEK